jgi:hypothetical protein
MRFRGMDRNADGVITRQEWRGNAQSFNEHDSNGDGILSRAEVRGASREGDFSWWPDQAGDWTDARFSDLDDNADGVISRGEWQGTRGRFVQMDVNSDGIVSRREFLAAQRDASETGRRVVRVDATEPWTDTGISVMVGDTLVFEAEGTVRLSDAATDVAEPNGSRTGRRAPNAPLSQEAAGALVARIGNSSPMLIGQARTIGRAGATGRLYLGVNDDHHPDNSGEFRVGVSVHPRGTSQ